MDKRHFVAGIMLISAFAIWFLAAVRADDIGYYQPSDLALSLVGVLFGIGSIAVSGDLSDGCMNEETDEYEVTLDVIEPDLNGSYSGQPHTYRKRFTSAEAAKEGLEELLWECVEIEGIGSGRIWIEYHVEKNGFYYDCDEGELEIYVEHTNEPSKLFADNGFPIPPSVDREKSYFRSTENVKAVHGARM